MIPDLRPLWESLHEHHVSVAPQLAALGPIRSPAETWLARSERYTEWLSEPDAFVLVARHENHAVGYAMVHMHRQGSWGTGDRIAEIETLTVLPQYRGAGIGGQLVAAIRDELARIGIAQLSVAVITTNHDAIRFYERLGLLPFVVTYVGDVSPAGSASEP